MRALERVPQTLTQQGVCLGHYLDEAFTRVSRALELCRRGQPLDPAVLDWLLEQGDFTVRLLSRNDLMQSSEQRSRLLELLLCLANVQRVRAASCGLEKRRSSNKCRSNLSAVPMN